MRRTWPFFFAVLAVGGGAGVAIAGRPQPADPFVIDPGSVATTAVPTIVASVVVTTAPTATGEPAATTGASDGG